MQNNSNINNTGNTIPSTSTTQTTTPSTNQTTIPSTTPSTTPSVNNNVDDNVKDYKKMSPAELFKDFISKIGADKIDETFNTFLNNTFSGYVTNSEYATDYNGTNKYYSKIINIGQKITDLDTQLKNLIPSLQNNYRRMVQNLIKVQIYSHYDKVVKDQIPPEDNKEQYEKMVTDILDLVNKSLDQSNQVFENRLGNGQAGGSSNDNKVNVMSKYFNYKLKYMMLKNLI